MCDGVPGLFSFQSKFFAVNIYPVENFNDSCGFSTLSTEFSTEAAKNYPAYVVKPGVIP